jgi:geranylgeranyl diphosphate synthase type I
MRRGRESIVTKYGLSVAILASDLLLFNVPKMVAKYEDLGSKRLAKVFDLVGEACRAATWGEFIDMEMTGRGEETEAAYEDMIRLKTSGLLSAPCASGAIVGGATDEEVALANGFGEELGLAYQIQDDTLDLVGDESVLGKPVLTDLREGKKGLVLIHCLSRCAIEDREFVLGLLGRSGAYTPEEVARLKRVVEEQGSLDYAHERVLKHTTAAKETLGSLPESSAKFRLLELTDYLASRYY